MRRGTVLALLLAVSGCVTNYSGGLPQPAPKADRVQAYLDLARGLLAERNFERAAEPLERALELDPNALEGHVLMAVLSEGRNEPALAETSYERALRIDRNNSMALNNYGGFLLRQGRQQEALTYLRRAVEDPSYQRRDVAYENLGVAELAAGNPDQAKIAFARALGLNQDLPRANLELAALEFESGNVPFAYDFYENYRENVAKQEPRGLCLGIRIANAMGDRDRQASYAIQLRNLHPRSQEAKTCVID